MHSDPYTIAQSQLSPEILYQDACMVVVDKPSGMLVHPSGKPGQPNVVDYLRLQLHDPEIRPVHRLDRQTSGILLLAKTAQMARYFGNVFTQRGVEKVYLAQVHGRLKEQTGAIDLPLGKDYGSKVAIRRKVLQAGGESATTLYRTLACKETGQRLQSLLWLKPTSGRRHQLRVHLHALGHPIMDDPIYDLGDDYYLALRNSSIVAKPMHLHAWRMHLPHPERGNLDLATALPFFAQPQAWGLQNLD